MNDSAQEKLLDYFEGKRGAGQPFEWIKYLSGTSLFPIKTDDNKKHLLPAVVIDDDSIKFNRVVGRAGILTDESSLMIHVYCSSKNTDKSNPEEYLAERNVLREKALAIANGLADAHKTVNGIANIQLEDAAINDIVISAQPVIVASIPVKVKIAIK